MPEDHIYNKLSLEDKEIEFIQQKEQAQQSQVRLEEEEQKQDCMQSSLQTEKTKDKAEEDSKSQDNQVSQSQNKIFTITKQDIHGVSDGMKIRRLTPTECERLQGFPDGWTDIELINGKRMSDTQRYKMMGNAVTVNVIKAIGEKLK